jgi:uroporphyrinogen decarboxylase
MQMKSFTELPPLKRRCYEAMAHQESDVIPYTVYLYPQLEAKLDEYYGGRDKRPRYENHTCRILRPEWIKQQGGFAWDPYGCKFDISHDAMKLIEHPLKEPSLKNYQMPDIMPDYLLDEARKTAQENKERFVYYQFTGCFWGRTWRLRGVENWLMDIYDHPNFVEDVLDALADVLIAGIKRAASLPIDAIVVGDDYAMQKGLMVSPQWWRQIIKPREKRVYDAVLKTGKMLGVHCCGDVSPILKDYAEMGVQMLHPLQEESVDIAWAKKTAGSQICFRGGIGVQHIIPYGTADEVRKYVKHCAKVLAPGGGWLAETGKPLGTETPVENATAFLETLVETCERKNK